jgi:2-amino-4-hydroxy-6-hydroxymethyldihydropteridine diphosphokinase
MSHNPIAAYLSLGSNLGPRIDYLNSAFRQLDTAGCRFLGQSHIYETEPVDHLNQPLFLNCVVEIQTTLAPLELLRRVQEIEAACGRARAIPLAIPKGPRTLDIDILLYGDLVMLTAELAIPHPAMLKRRFVLEPLNELVPGLIIPGTNQTVAAALALLPERPAVRRYTE